MIFYISLNQKQEAKGIKKGVSIYLGMNYLLFICFRSGYFLMHFLTKSRTEACTTLLWNYYRFLHKREEIKKFRIFIISIQFLCIINSVHLYELLPLASCFFVYLWSTNIINFVGDHQMNIPTKFGSNCPSGFREED
jgi:CDP-diglyceride synthetase